MLSGPWLLFSWSDLTFPAGLYFSNVSPVSYDALAYLDICSIWEDQMLVCVSCGLASIVSLWGVNPWTSRRRVRGDVCWRILIVYIWLCRTFALYICVLLPCKHLTLLVCSSSPHSPLQLVWDNLCFFHQSQSSSPGLSQRWPPLPSFSPLLFSLLNLDSVIGFCGDFFWLESNLSVTDPPLMTMTLFWYVLWL